MIAGLVFCGVSCDQCVSWSGFLKTTTKHTKHTKQSFLPLADDDTKILSFTGGVDVVGDNVELVLVF